MFDHYALFQNGYPLGPCPMDGAGMFKDLPKQEIYFRFLEILGVDLARYDRVRLWRPVMVGIRVYTSPDIFIVDEAFCYKCMMCGIILDSAGRDVTSLEINRNERPYAGPELLPGPGHFVCPEFMPHLQN